MRALPSPRSSPGVRQLSIVGAAPSDEELARRICEGDSWAKEALYRKHFAAVWNTAIRLLNSRSDAQDVVQDTFLAAFQDIAALRDRTALSPWLLRITVRQAHRRFRRRKLLRVLGLDRGLHDGGLEHLANDEIDPEQRSELAELGRALERLPTANRVAWSLRRIEGYSLEETAAACECALATVKRRIRAADDEIRRYVDLEGGDDA